MNNLTEDNFTGINHEGTEANRPLKYLTASSIIGDHVHNKQEEHIGKIKDIMLNVVTGEIDYYVIEFGGLFGIGSKYFAIPFALVSIDAEKHQYVFNKSKAELEKAPGFDLDHWPDTNTHWDRVYDYWSFA